MESRYGWTTEIGGVAAPASTDFVSGFLFADERSAHKNLPGTIAMQGNVTYGKDEFFTHTCIDH